MPVMRAASSTARSARNWPQGVRRRDGAIGVVLVKSSRLVKSILGMRYMTGRQRATFAVLMFAPAGLISAFPANMTHVQRQEFSILVEREFGFGHRVAPLRVGHEGFRARGLPTHRAADFFAATSTTGYSG